MNQWTKFVWKIVALIISIFNDFISLLRDVKTTVELFNYQIFNFSQKLLSNKKWTLRIWVHRFIFRGAWAKNKIKKHIGYIHVFLWCFTVFVAHPWYKFAIILLKFKPLPSMNSTRASVKLSYALDTTSQLQ